MTTKPMKSKIWFNVKKDYKIVDQAERIPLEGAGWSKVRYKGRWYQLFGGVRCTNFIDLGNPLKQAPTLRGR